MRLTDLTLKKLKPPATGQKTHFDDSLRGFGIRVSQGGTKSFIVLCGRERKRRTLGKYPELSLANARLAAKRVQADYALTGSRSTEHESIPFEAAKARFLDDCRSRLKASTVREYERLLNRHFAYDKSIGDLQRVDIMRPVEALSASPSEGKHAFVAIRTMMNWCHRHGMIEVTPVPPVSFKSESRERTLSDDELRLVWHRADTAGYPYGHIVQLLILTGQRKGEIAGLRYEWLVDDTIVFPTGFTKNKRQHQLPLGTMARNVIASAPIETGLLYPARGKADTTISGWSKYKRAFDIPLPIERYTLHDLRRTFATKHAQIGTPIHVTEKLLNHVSGSVSGVAAVYNRHSYLPEMQEAITNYEAHLANILDW